MKKYLIVSIVCFLVAGLASTGLTADGDYTIPDGQVVGTIEDGVFELSVRMTLKYYIAQRDTMIAKRSVMLEEKQNALNVRDSANATIVSLNEQITEQNTEIQAITARIIAIREAMAAAVTVEEPTE